MNGRHIALVPVFAGDSRQALEFAARVAPEVIAVGFERRPELELSVPLVIVESRERSWNQSVERVIALLKRRERPDRITLVLPESLAALFADTEVEVAPV